MGGAVDTDIGDGIQPLADVGIECVKTGDLPAGQEVFLDVRHGIFNASLLLGLASAPVLIGTWADATWAIRFYERYGFQVVDLAEKNRLLKKYWSVVERQIETSVVLADQNWRALGRGRGTPETAAAP